MKAGFIGYRNFAEKLKKVFDQTYCVRDYLFFHPEKRLGHVASTTELSDLFSCDFIVIASPDATHGNYLRRLQEYDGYIFCEKIPVVTTSDLEFLKKNPNDRLYFNFNYRKSLLAGLLAEHSSEILHCSHKYGIGFALLAKYRSNWRARADQAPLGVFQLTGIHFLDLLTYSFGRPDSYRTTARSLSPYGDSIDSFGINLEFATGLMADMFFSYTSPYISKTEIITTENIIHLSNSQVEILSPRETFDADGLFAKPPTTSRHDIDLYGESLQNSVAYFLEIVSTNGIFSTARATSNLLSTEIFLEIAESIKDENAI